MKHIDEYLAHKLEQRKLQGNLRHLTTNKAPIDFYSNDYLGLATNSLLKNEENSPAGYQGQWFGSTGSRLLSGNSTEAEALEELIARFHHAKAALLFNSGYDANIGLLSSIASRDTTILYDELCHASLIDGIRLSQCNRKYKFRHNDLAHLEEKLRQYAVTATLIVVVESIYSMDGDMAPLPEIVDLCEQYDAQLIVDEAHATGVCGKNGEGLVCALGLQSRVHARIHTFGKALGCHGATVVGSELLKQYLVNFARSFIYTTALPGHSVWTIGNAYKYLMHKTFSNQPLHERIAYFRQQVQRSGSSSWTDNSSPIQILMTGDGDTARQYAAALRLIGIEVKPILYPTVPPGKERLRICLHTFNTKEQINLLFKTLHQ